MYSKTGLVLSLAVWLAFMTGVRSGETNVTCYKCFRPIPTVTNGAYKRNPEYTEAILKCDKGFVVSGNDTLTCEKGYWSETFGTCEGLTGTCFLTVFPSTQIQDTGNLRQLLITASNVSTSVSITLHDGSMDVLDVTDFATQDYPVNNTLETSDAVNDTVFVIQSDAPINVHTLVASVDTLESAGSFLAFPCETSSTEYILITTEQTPQFNIISAQDNTTVTIDLVNGDPTFSVNLDQYEVYTYFLTNKDDLTGSTIQANKGVFVLSGGVFARIPIDSGSRDMNVAQMVGVQEWKTSCIMGPYKPRDGFQYKIVASENGTSVDITINGVLKSIQLDRGGKYEELLHPNVTNTAVVSSNKPVLVAQFSLNNGVDDQEMKADSSMTLCVPPEAFLPVYAFFAPPPSERCHVRILIDSAYTADLRLNGEMLSTFDQVTGVAGPGGTYDFVYIDVMTDAYYMLKTISGQVFGAELYCLKAGGRTGLTHTLGRKFGE